MIDGDAERRVTYIGEQFGVPSPRCENCRHFRQESDGDYGEIDCGTWCDSPGTIGEKPFEVDSHHLCRQWQPEFWHTRFAKQVDGTQESLRQAVNDHYVLLGRYF